MKHTLYFMLIVCALHPALAQIGVSGVVVDKVTGKPIYGVSVYVNDSNKSAITDTTGYFVLNHYVDVTLLTFRHVGYEDFEIELSDFDESQVVKLEPKATILEEVLVNTGYQMVAPERSTGSFIRIAHDRLTRVPAANILERLDMAAAGLQFDNRSGTPVINIRGINSFSSTATQPLIVVDNFPYEGDMGSINPDDVESVTLLKDAAAASIWGARAGNGVIVITTKRGADSTEPQIGFAANTILEGKPDLGYYQPMSSSDFIEVERFLFENGFYDGTLNSPYANRLVFSPVVEWLNQHKKGEVSEEDVNSRIDEFKRFDYRDDLLDHFYRNSIRQRYNFDMTHQSNRHTLRASLGYDTGRGNLKGSGDNRTTLRLLNTVDVTKKLKVNTTISYTTQNNKNNGGNISYPITPGGGKSQLYPYAQLVSENGSALAIPKDYNLNFVDTAGQGRLFDWHYRPYDEIGNSSFENDQQYLNGTLQLIYRWSDYFSTELSYNIEKQVTSSSNLYGMESYHTRNLVNRFTQLTGEGAEYNLPVGDILSRTVANLTSQRFRGQLNFSRAFNRHAVAFLLGGEASQAHTDTESFGSYGYNRNVLTSRNVDYTTAFRTYAGMFGNAYIPSFENYRGTARKFISFFGNASYTYLDRYTLSFSARRDASNVFGVQANDRWNPLWSAGAAWNLGQESFLIPVSWVDMLRLRLTYGHSGNISTGGSSRTILQYVGNANYTNLPYAIVGSPPNPHLKWEDVRMVNYGVDFSLFRSRFSGTIEYFTKKSSDLISIDPIDPTTGYGTINRNVGEIQGKGIDITLNVKVPGKVTWTPQVGFSYAQDIVTAYRGGIGASLAYLNSRGQTLTPLPDKALYPVFSYRFAGLDAENGDPLGFLNGEVSNAYNYIVADSLKNLEYHGSALPPYYGFFSHDIAFGNIAVFVNISYKFGHYFKRSTISYSDLYNTWVSHADYERRWTKPGDELSTNIPSRIYPANTNRDVFYLHSSANVDRGDVIRLQNVRLSYSINNTLIQRYLKSVSLFGSANNVCILWRRTKSGVDPDYNGLPQARNYVFGLTCNF